MLTDLGLQTEEQINVHNKTLQNRDRYSGCVGTRICTNCKHLISDSICLCVAIFTCPNCKFENGKNTLKNVREELKILNGQNPFMFSSIKDYEQTVGFPVNEAFKMGWDMARTPSAKQNNE